MRYNRRESNDSNFMALLNFLADPTVIVDEKGVFLAVNDAVENLTGLSKKEFVGKNFLEIKNLTPETKAILAENLRKRMQSLHIEPYEISLIDKDGQMRYFELTAKKIDYAGQPADVVILRDITRRKENARRLKEYSEKMEELVNAKVKEIKESEEKYRELIKKMNDTVWVIDLNGKFIDVNDAAVKILGYSRDELLCMGPADIDNNLTKEQIHNLVRNMPADRIQVFETMHTTKDGAEIPVEISSSLVTYQGKQAILSIARDITERRRLEEALRASEEMFRAISTCAKDAIVAVNSTGEVVYWNPAAEQIFGYSQEEAVGKNVLNLLVPPRYHGFQQSLFELVESSQLLQGKILEFTALRKGGKEFPAELSAAFMPFKGAMCLVGVVRDVSERKKAEAKLLASEKKYRRLFKELKRAEKQLLIERDRAQNYLDIAGVMLVALDTKGRVTLLNRKACAILKCTAEEALGKNWFNTFLPKDTKNNVKKIFQASIKGKKCLLDYNENYVISKSGEAHLIAWHNVILKNSKGQVIGTLSSGEDITERRKIEMKLQEAEKRYRMLFNQAPVGIMLIDQAGTAVEFNEEAHRQLGYSREEFAKLTISDYEALETPAETRAHMRKILRTGRDEFETKHRTKNGEIRDVINTVQLIELGGEKFFHVITRDITEQKKIENELKMERDKLEAVTENVGAGLAIISKDYRILWVNKLMKQLNGDCEGKRCYSTFNRLNRVCPDCGVKKVFENGVPIDIHEYTSQDDSGNRFWVELIVTPIKDVNGNVTAALELAVNVTERKIMQNKLAEYSQKLEKLVEKRTEQLKQTQAKLVKSERLAAIGELAAMVGHDLRNPLTGIKGAAYYLKTKYSEEIDPAGKAMLRTIDECIEHSNKIINDLLEYSRDVKLELSVTNPKTLLAQCISMLKIPKKIQVVCEAEENPTVKVDVARMNRVLLNILQNAVDAMPDGGTLTITSKKVEDKLEISVTDTGIGMSKKTIAKLWTPLFTTKAKGMGFGLSICKRIVEAHQGEISVKSKLGEGSTFTVSIPLHPKLASEAETMVFNESALSAMGHVPEVP
ncbi:PAS domain-containing sensor histidine kinase [Candidatus Bathyarchaeota archaeon A05DMB-2]|jgi:PAS domain S-box-containing protein|nr:PAS domain-containing sensor histidine kinase [Candidatus Bathyarchaeota archaeon A05DMB-2]